MFTLIYAQAIADHVMVVQEVFEQILAGSDTTSAAIRVVLLYIISHPRVYAKLQAEIDETVKNGLAPPSPDVISDAELRRLPYLGAVVREAMRVSLPFQADACLLLRVDSCCAYTIS